MAFAFKHYAKSFLLPTPSFLPQLTPSTQICILNRETVTSPATAHAPASEGAARSQGLFPHLNACHRNHYQTFPMGHCSPGTPSPSRQQDVLQCTPAAALARFLPHIQQVFSLPKPQGEELWEEHPAQYWGHRQHQSTAHSALNPCSP